MKAVLYYLFLVLGLATSAWAQLDTESIPPAQDQRDLFARAAASRLAVIGTVIKSEGVVPREIPKTSESSNRRDRRASLYTVQVEEIVCRQTDFDSKAPRVDDRPQPLVLFIPFDESDLPNGHFREAVLPKRRYLLLLAELDTGALTAGYELDPNRIYYRGEGQNRGVIPFEPLEGPGKGLGPPDVIDKFKRLCAAMRPPKAEDKLGLLHHLADSGDPVLQKAAEEAQRAVKASMENEPDETPKKQ